MNEVRNEINRLENEKYQIGVKQKTLLLKEAKLNLEQQAIDQKAKLDEKRNSVINKEKALRLTEKSFPECPHFLGQLKEFDHRFDAWIKTTKDKSKILEYLEEMNLISQIHKQYKLCIGILERELRRNIVGFRTELSVWKNKIEREIKALKKSVK